MGVTNTRGEVVHTHNLAIDMYILCPVCKIASVDIGTVCVGCGVLTCNRCWFARTRAIQAEGDGLLAEVVALVESPRSPAEVRSRDRLLRMLSEDGEEGTTRALGTCVACECPVYLDRHRRRAMLNGIVRDAEAPGADSDCMTSAAIWLAGIDLDCVDMCCTDDPDLRHQRRTRLLLRVATAAPDHLLRGPSREILEHIVAIAGLACD